MSTRTLTITTHSAAETTAIGEQLGALVTAGQVIALCGPLGSGKTTFTKGVAAGLGVADPHAVTSPTFVLIREYAGRLPIAHADVYRLDDEAAMARIGLEDYLTGPTVCLIEWAEKCPSLLPADHLQVTFEHASPDERRIHLAPRGSAAAQLINRLRRALPRQAVS